MSGGVHGSLLFVVAHPDDVANTMAGTALRLAPTHTLHVVCASRGERGYAWRGAGPVPPDAELAAIRESEERAACAALGAGIEFLGLVDGEIHAERRAVGRVAELLAALRPRALFTHAASEKPDHAAVHCLAYQALHAAGRARDTELLMPVWGGGTMHPGHVDALVDIGAVIERKRALIRLHRTQHPDEAAVESRLTRNRDLGRWAGCAFAEGWCLGSPPPGRGSEVLRGLAPESHPADNPGGPP
jgi:LmbE family N-acetylglucosaminyl deacetylase